MSDRPPDPTLPVPDLDFIAILIAAVVERATRRMPTSTIAAGLVRGAARLYWIEARASREDFLYACGCAYDAVTPQGPARRLDG